MVVNGLGGGNEVVGGMWLFLVSVAALRTNGLPRLLGYFGMIVSVAGLLTTIPPLKDLGAVFGLGLIAWFAWLTLHLFYLLGGRNKVLTLADWMWNYLTFDRGNRHIMDSQ